MVLVLKIIEDILPDRVGAVGFARSWISGWHARLDKGRDRGQIGTVLTLVQRHSTVAARSVLPVTLNATCLIDRLAI
jgi:hypothetical protein